MSKRQSNHERNNPLLCENSSYGFYQYFNVLWVKQKGDCFVRKALGRVKAEVGNGFCTRSEGRVVLG